MINGTNISRLQDTAMRQNPIYITYYIFWSKFIFVEIIPYLTIMILNSMIISKIYKSNRFRRRFVVRIKHLGPCSVNSAPCVLQN